MEATNTQKFRSADREVGNTNKAEAIWENLQAEAGSVQHWTAVLELANASQAVRDIVAASAESAIVISKAMFG